MFQFWSNGKIQTYSLVNQYRHNVVAPVAPGQKAQRLHDRSSPVPDTLNRHEEHAPKAKTKQQRLIEIYRETIQRFPKQHKPAMVVSEIMTSPVNTLVKENSIREAFDLFQRKGFRHIPITTAGGILSGIISDRDLLNLPKEDLEVKPRRRIHEIMQKKVLTVSPDAKIVDAAAVLLNENFSSLPVTDADGKVLGIITTTDILHAIVLQAPIDLWA